MKKPTLSETLWYFDHVNIELLAKIIQLKLKQ